MRVCVVEDESAVRAGIIHKLTSLAKPIQVFDVQFGLAALEKIKLIRPDLVITDIMMPELDGLEMLRLIKQALPMTAVVLLSGYNEFEYARRGLQHGALNYLLKPLDRNELLEVINKVERELEDRLHTVLAPCVRQLEQSHIELKQLEYYAPALGFNETIPKKIRLQHPETCTKLLGEYAHSIIVTFVLNHKVKGALVEGLVDEDRIFYQLNELVPAIRYEYERWETENFMGSAYTPDLVRVEPCDKVLRTSAGIRKLMLKDIKDMNVASLEQQLFLYCACISKLPLKAIRKECALLMAFLDEAMTAKDDVAIVEEDKIMYWGSWVAQHINWKHLQKEIERFVVGGVKALLQLENKTHPIGIVDRALHLVAQQDDRQHSLESIADQLEIHPVTLSRIFKQQQGENFVHYLTRHKMSQAERLLIQTDKKVSDIAEEVGYHDHRYFSLLFKKAYGETPTEYRKKNALNGSRG